MTANFTNHYEMKKVTTVKTQQIYSAAGERLPAGVLITKQLETKSERYVLIYADTPNGKATAHFVPNQKHITTAVKKSSTYKTADVDKATLTTKTTRWEWKNQTAKKWLNVGDQAGELVNQKQVVTIPEKTWIAVTPSQMKKLKTMTAQNQQTSSQILSASMSKEQLAGSTVQKIKHLLQ